MNKVKKILISLGFISCILFSFAMNNMESNATFMDKAGQLVSQGGASDSVVTSVTSQLVTIGQILTYVGVGVLVAVTAYLGVQYIISSPDKQAVLKEKLIGVVVAGVVIFGSYKIWNSVVDMFKDL